MKRIVLLTVLSISCFSLGLLSGICLTNDKLATEQARGNMLEMELYNEQHKEKEEIKHFIGEHIITFYTHTGNRTASGKYPKANYTVAVDKKLIPFDTELYIEGIGYVTAHDTGTKIKGKRLDVFVNSKQEAIKKGVQKKKVWIVKR